jgi:hypothetical protein
MARAADLLLLVFALTFCRDYFNVRELSHE